MWFSLGLVCLVAFLVNLPLGAWRENTRKFSLWWFIAVHASIPLIIFLRLELGLSMAWVPLTIALAVVGQIVGSRYARKRVVVGRWS